MTTPIDPKATKKSDPKIYEAEVLPLPGSSGRAPEKITLDMRGEHGWSKDTLIMFYYYMYKTNLLSRNNLKSLFKIMETHITKEEAVEWLVKEVAKV